MGYNSLLLKNIRRHIGSQSKKENRKRHKYAEHAPQAENTATFEQ